MARPPFGRPPAFGPYWQAGMTPTLSGLHLLHAQQALESISKPHNFPAAGRMPAKPEAVCQATISFLHLLVGLILPTLRSAWAWQPPSEEEGPEEEAQGAEPRGGRAAGGSQGSTEGSMGRLARLASKGVAASDSCLHMLSGATATVRRHCACAALSWYMFACAWLFCRMGAGL